MFHKHISYLVLSSHPICIHASTPEPHTRSEALYESASFPERELAALVASKVYYHLEEFDDALKFALGAGQRFDVASKSGAFWGVGGWVGRVGGG